MNCPYCAEEIKDEAVVCRHCGHDFSLVKPLLTRVISLEKEVEAFSAMVVPSSTDTASVATFAAGIAVTLGVILTSGYFLVTGQQEDPANTPYIFAIALPPVFLGLLVGLSSSRRSPRTAATFGFTFGGLNFLLIWLMLGSIPGATFQWPLAFTTLVIGQSLTYTAFALLGNSLRGGMPPPPQRRHKGGLKGGVERLKANLSLVVEIIKSITFLALTVGSAYQWIWGESP